MEAFFAIGYKAYMLLASLAGVVLWVGGLQWTSMNNSKRIEKLEKQLDEDRKETKEALTVLRTEMLSNFAVVNTTLKEVIFRLGDRNGESR